MTIPGWASALRLSSGRRTIGRGADVGEAWGRAWARAPFTFAVVPVPKLDVPRKAPEFVVKRIYWKALVPYLDGGDAGAMRIYRRFEEYDPMIRKGLFASALVASALFAAPQAQAAINFGSVSAMINQLNNHSSFAANTMSFSINNGGQSQTLFTGVTGVRNFNSNANSMAQFNNWAGTANAAPTGYNGYKFTYSVVGSFFNNSGTSSRSSAPEPEAEEQGTASRIQPLAAPIPEPGTWAMMIVGMGVVGMTMRRRSNHKAKYFA